MSPEVNLAGKDYFTEIEAAHYVGLSHSHFRRNIRKLGVRSFNFCGKKLYRKSDLQHALESAWQQSSSTVASGILTSVRTGSATGVPLTQARKPKPN